MPVSASTLRALMASGLQGEALASLVEMIDADMASVQPKPSTNAERQRRYRERHTKSNVTSNVTDVTLHSNVTSVSLETKAPTPLKTQTLSKENPPKGGQKKGTEAFDRFKAAYPKRAGNNPWEPARQKFAAAVADGVDPECIVGGAANYAAAEALLNHVGTEFVMQAKTWLNQKCWQDYGDAVDGEGRMIAKSDMRWQFLVARYEREKGKKFPHRAERWPFPEAWLHDANNATPKAPRWLLREPALWTA